jgi:hypothetical protein
MLAASARRPKAEPSLRRLRKLASAARLAARLGTVVAELGNDSHRDKERERRRSPALQRLPWSGAGALCGRGRHEVELGEPPQLRLADGVVA